MLACPAHAALASGGDTVQGLYDALLSLPLTFGVAWGRVERVPDDDASCAALWERCVNPR